MSPWFRFRQFVRASLGKDSTLQALAERSETGDDAAFWELAGAIRDRVVRWAAENGYASSVQGSYYLDPDIVSRYERNQAMTVPGRSIGSSRW